MESLPTELLHGVFQHLSLNDVCNVRLSSKIFGEVGQCHLIKEIYLLPITPSLERLQRISESAVLRPHITSLFFEADTIRSLQSYDNWYRRIPSDSLRERHRPTPPSFRIHSNLSESWLRATARCTALRDQYCKTPAGAPHMDTALDDDISDPVHTGGLERMFYGAFQELAEDIAAVYKNNTYTPILHDAVAHLPALKHVSLSIQAGVRPRCAKFYSVFERGLIIPFCDERQQPRQGEQQLFGLLEALAAAETKLESLEIAYINYRVLKQEVQPERMSLWGAQMSSLKRLTLGISLGHLFDSYYRRKTAQLSLPYLASSGALVKLLASAPLLRHLSVRFDWDDPYPANLEDVIGDTTWPHLREVELAYVYASRSTLEGFFARHSSTLRRLKLTHVALCGLQEDDDALRKAKDGFWEHWDGFRAVSEGLRATGLKFGWSELDDREGRWVDLELWKD